MLNCEVVGLRDLRAVVLDLDHLATFFFGLPPLAPLAFAAADLAALLRLPSAAIAALISFLSFIIHPKNPVADRSPDGPRPGKGSVLDQLQNLAAEGQPILVGNQKVAILRPVRVVMQNPPIDFGVRE